LTDPKSIELPSTVPVTLAPSRHDTEIDRVPFREEPLWLNVTANVPEPALELAVHVPFHLPSSAAAEPPPPDVPEETGEPVLVKVPVGAVELLELLLLELLVQAAKRAPHTRNAAHIRRAAERIIRSPFPRLWTDAHAAVEF
jgi:hypothetical protein